MSTRQIAPEDIRRHRDVTRRRRVDTRAPVSAGGDPPFHKSTTVVGHTDQRPWVIPTLRCHSTVSAAGVLSSCCCPGPLTVAVPSSGCSLQRFESLKPQECFLDNFKLTKTTNSPITVSNIFFKQTNIHTGYCKTSRV